jgi:hypothetical protein
MASLRDEAARDLEVLISAVDELGERLRATRENYTVVQRSLEAGEAIAGALQGVGADETRQALTAVLDDFERVRHVSRLSLIAADLEEGSTINEISRTWGISRQLASRYVKAIRVEV